MFVNYKLNLDRPGTHFVSGCKNQVVMYPIIARDDNGVDHELNRLLMDKESTIDILAVTLDEKLVSDDRHLPPLLTIVSSHVTGNVHLTRGEIAHSNIISSGVIDTSGSIINSKLEGHVAVEGSSSIVSSRTGVGSTVLIANQSIIETSEINGALVMMEASAMYASIINTTGTNTSTMSGHATIIKCKMEKPFKLRSSLVIYNGGIIYGTPVEGIDKF